MTLYIIYLLSLLGAMVAALRADVQMFQQNSYRYSRYFRWQKGNLGAAFGRKLAVILPAYFCYWVATIVELDELVLLIPTLVNLIYMAQEFRRKFKVRIAYTPRVKRLLLSSLVLAVGVAVGLYLVLPELLVYLSVGLLLLSNLILILANVVNSPVERAITQWYINDARKIIASRSDLIIIGVTGSYGKTSTKNYLYRMLTEKYNVLVTPGNYNTLLGVVRTIREQLRPQHQVFIVEMGAKQRGDIKEICDLVHPAIGIVTSVGEAHLETFGSIENIQKTKFELIDSLPASGLGVVNLDSESIKSYSYSAQGRMVSYSVEDSAADFVAQAVSYNSLGVSFGLDIAGEVVTFRSPLLGGGNVLNLLAGVIVATELGVGAGLLQRAIQQLHPVEHRLSMSRSGGLTILDDAYNSNPSGAKMALDVLRDFTRPAGAKRVVITPGFVEMGENQAAANYTLGCQIAASVDYAVVVNRHNREAIVAGLVASNFSQEQYFVADSLDQARAHLSTILGVGDVLLYENDLPDSFK